MSCGRNKINRIFYVLITGLVVSRAAMVLHHFLLFLKHIVLSENTSLYFFSALFQGNAVLFAILGVFVVFRLQIERSSIDSIEQILLKDIGDFFAEGSLHLAHDRLRDFKKTPIEQKRNIAKNYRDNSKKRKNETSMGSALHLRLPDLLYDWIASEQQMNEIKTQIKLPIYLLATFMALSLVGLIFATPIHRSDGAVELSILIAMAGGNIYLLYYLARCVNRFLNHSDEKKREPK